MSLNDYSDHCRVQTRTYDYDRYFAAMTANAGVRRGLLALYAFNYEIASVRERVSEPLIGQMRMQWWRDTISEFAEGRVRDHPVAVELSDAISRFGLPTARFERMLDARTFDLSDDPPEDMEAFNNYIAATAGELTALAATICGADETVAERCVKVGSLWGRVGILRSVNHSAASGKIYLPKSLMTSAGISTSDIIENRNPPPLKGLAQEIVAGVIDEMSRIGRMEKSLRPAIAYLGIAKIYLKRLEKARFDIWTNARLEPSRGRCQLSTLSTAMTGRI